MRRRMSVWCVVEEDSSEAGACSVELRRIQVTNLRKNGFTLYGLDVLLYNGCSSLLGGCYVESCFL